MDGFSGLFLFRVAVSVIGVAVFVYALRTEPDAPVPADRSRFLPAVLLALVLACAITVSAEEVELVKQVDCDRWWAEGDYYRYFLHSCYLLP